MCNFNKQNDDTKALMHLFMTKSAATIGGVNYLLALLEAIRAQKPHPLIYNKCKIESQNVKIEWNKIIFKDKLEVIEEILLTHKSSENPDFNLLNIENQKKKKRILNVIKALIPVDFIVTPKNPDDGGGFEFKIFDTVALDEEKVILNPVFIAIFFCSVEYTKKALKYEM